MQGARRVNNSIIPKKDWSNLVGQIFKTNRYGFVEVIYAYHSKNIKVKFINTGYISTVWYKLLKKGQVVDPTAPRIQGIACVGIGKYSPKKNRKAYATWYDILRRVPKTVNCDNYLPSYSECEVCQEWLNFQNFAEWFEANYKPNFEIDKDLLYKYNKLYSPQTCCMIPKELNLFIIKRTNERNLAIGVEKSNSPGYISRCRNPFKKKSVFLGYYKTEVEAFDAYKQYKEQLFKLMAAKYKGVVSERVYKALIEYEVLITD